jgi:SsrA-binding protein
MSASQYLGGIPMSIKILSNNNRAYHEYFIDDKIEAGIALTGTEVKAARTGKVNLSDGWVEITDKGEAWLREVHISRYSHGNQMNHEEKRSRRLLLHRREIAKLAEKTQEKGLTVVPLKMYFKNQFIKVEIGVAKGKKLHDKRETSKKKEADRDMQRAMRSRSKG